MLHSYQDIKAISRSYKINEEDVILIALNASGVRSSMKHPRIRFNLRLHARPEEKFFLIVPIRDESPFELLGGRILLQGEPIAYVECLENDDAVLSYFRNEAKVLTLNSNARSQCVGCAFCYTVLQDKSDPRLRTLDDIKNYFSLVKDTLKWDDLSPLDTLAVCTGCFHHENNAIDHLVEFRRLLKEQKSQANIHFLSSVIRSRESFKRILEEVAPFHLTLTIECFSNREIILKGSKASLTYDQMIETLRLGKEHQCKVDFTYIVGLDSFDEATKKLPDLVNEVNTFPRFQIFQSHGSFMSVLADQGAQDIEYFLQMRKFIENLFIDRPLRPQSWENYRPLWYFTFADEELKSVRI